ncbi:MAG TPA: metallophosphoesterase [Bacteroidales bacterium]|nr:metallophosphoesterase [Bacteroidales bacterium]
MKKRFLPHLFLLFVFVISNRCAYSQSFTFVHISDMHISDGSGNIGNYDDDGEQFLCNARQFKLLNPKPAFIVVSGDVSNIGSKSPNGMYPALTQHLYPQGGITNPANGAYFIDQDQTIPIYFVSGNHEYYESILLALDQTSTLTYYPARIAPDVDYTFTYNNAQLIFMRTGSDVSLWNSPEDGAGITNSQCQWLRNVLNPAGGWPPPDRRKIIIMHHPAANAAGTEVDGSPYTGYISGPASNSFRYNRVNFLNICDSNNVDVTLSGHVHQCVVADRNGNVVPENWAGGTRYSQIANANEGSYRIITVDSNFVTLSPPMVVPSSLCGTGPIISGRVRYAGKAYAGTYGNYPTYDTEKYAINKVLVLLKNYPSGTVAAKDTTDASGFFRFNNVPYGSYTVYYDKITADTMQWGNDINAIDISQLKYLIASDPAMDPSFYFSEKYKRAADVDNNMALNAIDVSRIKAKIGSPSSAVKNFPKGNWPAYDSVVSISGSDLNLSLPVICYGDFNASSFKYKDSLSTWSMAKSIENEIIMNSDEYITAGQPSWFEVPLRISDKMNEFSAMGLELHYPADDYRLEQASMSKGAGKDIPVKINPTLEEIIASDDDLLVTDEHGVVRVVYATTSHFDVAAGDEMMVLGFRALRNPTQGELDFNLSGTGVFGNRYGEENDNLYLLKPKIFVQGDNPEAGFEFMGYPNPFGGDVKLTYYIPEQGSVKIEVYNTMGRLLAILLNEYRENGKHTVEFSPGDLPAGMYIFRFEYNGQNLSKSLTLKMLH